jgi:outer membrane protein assembly factor BamE (lipoprotein component of BamABCDE complex)
MRLIYFLFLVASVAACQPFVDGWQSGSHTQAIMKLQVGMSRDEVLSLMGQPQRREAYGSNEFLIYRTDYRGGNESADFTPVAIVNGKVVGWGRNYYDNVARSKIDADITVKNR